MKKTIVLSAFLCAAGFAGGYAIQSSAKVNNEGSAKASESVTAPTPPSKEVSTIQLKLHSIETERTLPGRISPYRQSVVRPQVDGIVVKRLFEEGALVEKGQQLYQIDDVRYTAVLNSAKADLARAKADVSSIRSRAKRYKELVKIDAISAQEYDDVIAELNSAKASIAVAQAAVDLAKVDVAFTKVYAPISGRISRSFITEGALITANQTQELAVITQLNPVYVDMQHSGSEENIYALTSKLQDGAKIPVSVAIEGNDGKVLEEGFGELKLSEITMDSSTASTTLRALVPNDKGRFLPGMYVRASVNLGEQNALLVPQRATSRTPNGKIKAWTVDENNVAHSQILTVKSAYKDQWIVTDGVKAGDQLIIEGYQKIKMGENVRTVAWNPPGAAASEKQVAVNN